MHEAIWLYQFGIVVLLTALVVGIVAVVVLLRVGRKLRSELDAEYGERRK